MTTPSTLVDRPRLGLCFDRTFPAAGAADFARECESAGLDELWFIEDCFYTTAIPMAAAALTVTERLTVGLGILPAVIRTAALTAMEISTLSAIGPGRVIAGIGHGVQDWMQQMGVKPASPLTALREVLTAVRGLLKGERLSTSGRYVTLRDVALQPAAAVVPPVIAGVRGVKSLALAGEVADGVLLDAPCAPETVRQAREICAAGPDFELRTFATLCVMPTREEAYQVAAGILGQMIEHTHDGLKTAPAADEWRAAHARGGRQALAEMSPELWSDFGAVGTVEDAAEYVRRMHAADVASIAFFPAPDIEVARGQIADVASVIEALDGRAG